AAPSPPVSTGWWAPSGEQSSAQPSRSSVRGPRCPKVLGLDATIIPRQIAASVYQSMRIAPVTAAIMLLASPSNADPLVSAADRVFEIALGSIVGLAVAIIVFPARAHGLLADKAARTLALLAEVLRN